MRVPPHQLEKYIFFMTIGQVGLSWIEARKGLNLVSAKVYNKGRWFSRKSGLLTLE